MPVLISDLFESPTEKQFKIINKNLNIDVKNFEENEALFLNWLKDHPTLPKEYDILLIRNFIRYCKNNLEKAKSKYENYVMVRVTIPDFYQNTCVDENSFIESLAHRCVTVVSKLTPDCYRIILLQLPKSDMNQKELNECLKYIFLHIDIGLSYGIQSGAICIVDFKKFNINHAKVLTFSIIKTLIHVVVNVYPSRFKQVHLLNVNALAGAIIGVAKYFLPEKIRKRIILHKEVNELLEYFEPHLIPSDYGGTDISTEENADRLRRFSIEQKEWILKMEKLRPLLKT